MTDSLVERVARALYEDDEPPADIWSPPWETLSDAYVDGDPRHCRSYWRRKARAAIAAMREPTEAISQINGSKNWPAMIDAAL